MGYRLKNLGLRGKPARFRTLLLHLDHDRPFRTEESIRKNLGIRRRIVRGKETRARKGLAELVQGKGAEKFIRFGPDRPDGTEPDWNSETEAGDYSPRPEGE